MDRNRRARYICSVAVATSLGFGTISIANASKDLDAPSFNNPRGLCDAISYLPTRGWHHDFMGWGCVSALKEYGPAKSAAALPSTYQYMVSGSAYKDADKVQLFYNVNNANYRSQSLRMMAIYAKTLDENTAFHFPKAVLAKIRHGRSFAVTTGDAKINFKMKKERIDIYVLSIIKNK